MALKKIKHSKIFPNSKSDIRHGHEEQRYSHTWKSDRISPGQQTGFGQCMVASGAAPSRSRSQCSLEQSVVVVYGSICPRARTQAADPTLPHDEDDETIKQQKRRHPLNTAAPIALHYFFLFSRARFMGRILF